MNLLFFEETALIFNCKTLHDFFCKFSFFSVLTLFSDENRKIRKAKLTCKCIRYPAITLLIDRWLMFRNSNNTDEYSVVGNCHFCVKKKQVNSRLKSLCSFKWQIWRATVKKSYPRPASVEPDPPLLQPHWCTSLNLFASLLLSQETPSALPILIFSFPASLCDDRPTLSCFFFFSFFSFVGKLLLRFF